MTRNGRAGSVAATLALVLWSAGCDDPISAPPSLDGGPRATAAAPSSGQRFRNLDEEFSHLAAVVPGGFGGLYYEQGRPVVYLKDLKQQAAAADAISAFLRARYPDLTFRTRRLAEMRFVQGQHDYAALAGWKRQTEGVAAQLPGLVLTDVAEHRNRVLVGVSSDAAVPLAQRVIERLGIPAGAVVVERRAPQELTATLDDRAPAVVGGYRLQWRTDSCTLGFNGYSDDVVFGRMPVFVTNSHCSRTRHVTDFHEYWQYLIGDAAHHIGYEYYDPDTFQGGDCMPNYRCRYADALLGHYESPRFEVGGIARTTGYGSKTISTQPSFRILRSVEFPYHGEEVERMGMMSGWQKGTVVGTCAPSYPFSGVALLCQDEVKYPTSIQGDSGAPVFILSPDYPGWVFLAGINWGGGGGMSAMMNIELDLGPLDVVRCEPGHPYYPNCT